MAEMIDEFLADAKERMHKSVESTRGELATVRTGRASPHLLDRIKVDYYGTETDAPAAREHRDHRRAPADPDAVRQVGDRRRSRRRSSSRTSGLTPNNDGNVIRLQIPELTEERRKEMVKVVHGVAEEGRVAVRNIRRDVMHDLRELKKEGEAGSDEEHRAETELQKLTDEAIGEIDGLLKGKEEEILEV